MGNEIWQHSLPVRVGNGKQQNSKGVGNLKTMRADSAGPRWQRLGPEEMEVILGLREHCWQNLGGRGCHEDPLSWKAVVCNSEH
jgi:hypothetical protein